MPEQRFLNKSGLERVWEAVKARDDAVKSDLNASIEDVKKSIIGGASSGYDTLKEIEEALDRLQAAISAKETYLSLSLTSDQQKQIEDYGRALIQVGKKWNGELAVCFWDEFAIYLRNGGEYDIYETSKVFDGDIPIPEDPGKINSHGWSGHMTIVWSGTVLDISKSKEDRHRALTSEEIEDILK